MKSSPAKLEQAVRQENLRDLLSVLAIGLAFPALDTLFGRYRFEVIARGELCKTYEELFHEGVLAEGTEAVAISGPNWKLPEFIIDKRYEE
ncbi:immunity protein [Pseudomonas sp. MBT-4]|uniref:Immunity protein n=1 Tax=Pseudomonas rustica TaxID=2827099 RepID=A0ABS5MUN1_9PSED|nr:immunity protein [Pseudomonas rustica]